MKQLKTTFSVAALLCTSLFWVGCQKELSTQKTAVALSNYSIDERVSGIISDDPLDVSLIPMLVSSESKKSFSATIIKDISARRSTGGGTIDITAPSVIITSPLNGSAISGSLNIAVSASDNVGVVTVSCSVDGVVIGNLTTAPYNFLWNTSTASVGTHTITSMAKDAMGNTSYSTITVAKNTVIVVVPPITLPTSFILTTPPISNQGNEGSCAPFSTAYAARSIEQFYRTGASSYNSSTNIFSVEYVYNQTKMSADCNSGTAITLTLDLMKNKGVCTSSTMPNVDGVCTAMPSLAQDAEAAKYKIASYSKLLSTDQVAIKTMIANKHAVIFSAVMDNSLINAGPGFIWSAYSGSGAFPHCMVICGYDDNKKAYKIMNSWGTAWGDAGYSWINYDFFSVKTGYYVYTMNY